MEEEKYPVSEAPALPTDENVTKLSDGLMKIYQRPLQKVSNSLQELTNKQKLLIENVSSQNLSLQSCQNSEELKQLFAEVIHCRQKLIIIKKQMVSIHERSNKLRVRSQNVLNRAQTRKSTRIQELEREQRLIGGQQGTNK